MTLDEQPRPCARCLKPDTCQPDFCARRSMERVWEAVARLDAQRRAFDAPLGVPTYPPKPAAPADPEYADVDTDGQLALGVAGDQRAIPGLAAPRKES